jgi:hypothetical protein
MAVAVGNLSLVFERVVAGMHSLHWGSDNASFDPQKLLVRMVTTK